MVAGLAGCAATCVGAAGAAVAALARVGAGGCETVATGVISAGLLTAATFREQAATDNSIVAVSPVMTKFACFIRLTSINAFDGQTGNPVYTVFLNRRLRLDLGFRCPCRPEPVDDPVGGPSFWQGSGACFC